MKQLFLSVAAAALIPVGVAHAFQPSCTYQIRPASIVLPAQGSAHPTFGFGLIEITSGANCAWTAATATSWIHLAPPSSGSGSALLFYMIDPNSGGTSRTGSVSVAGRTQTVIQAGSVGGCSYAVSPANSSVPAAGGDVSLTITASAGCFWGVEEFPTWVSTAEYPTGLGTGALVLTIAANNGSAARSGTVAIAGRSHTISQAGTGTPACTYSIAPSSASIPAAGGSGAVTVTAGSGCQWTAVSSAGWLTIPAGTSGSGNGEVRYTAAANTSTTSRIATLTVGGKTFTVTQAAATIACTYSISPTSAAVAATGGSGSVTVTVGTGCAWTAASNAAWLSIVSGASGSGSGTVQYSAAANTGTSARAGTLTIAGQTFTASQAVASATGAPSISSGGVVNTADYTANFAPGGMISIFGANLARSLLAAGPPPLPIVLDGTLAEAIIGQNIVSLPLFFVSPGQVNAQLPFDAPLGTLQVRVRSAAGVSDAETIPVSRSSPRLFTVPSGGSGAAALLHSNFQLVTPESPATPGEWLIVYLTGLGEVSPAVAAGRPGGDGAGKGPLNWTKEAVKVKVGGRDAEVYYAGLAPGYAGLYQVNFKVPDDALQGVPQIVIEASESSSQAAVTFHTSLKWSDPAVTTIGPAGGTASNGQMTVTVPAGALVGPHSLSICQTTGTSPVIGPMFELEGLPPTSAPVSVTIRTTGSQPPAQGTYLVVNRSDGSDVFVRATVQGNSVTALLPPRSQSTARGKALSSGVPAAADPDSAALILYLMSGIHETVSPKGHFDALTVGVSAGTEDTVLRGLDSALEQLMAMGFEDKIWPRLPLSITIAPVKTWDSAEYFGSVQNTGEYREAGGQISWWPRKTIRLDTNYASLAKKELAVLRADDLLRVKASHLLFHLVQQLYDTDNRNTLSAAGKPHPWDWWDEATAFVFERRLAGYKTYIPEAFWWGTDLTCGGNPFECGLENPQATLTSERWRGLALALFLDSLTTRRPDLRWIGNTYLDLDFLSASLLPSQTLVREFGEISLSSYWKEFAQSLGAGTPFLGQPPQSRFFGDLAINPGYVVINDETAKVSRSWSAPDISVKYFKVSLSPSSKFTAGARLKIETSGGIGFVRQALADMPGGDPVGTPGNAFDIPVDRLALAGDWLLVGVANVHVNSKQPHSDVAGVQFTIVRPSGCPTPTTPKAPGLNTAATSCGVSGGLDEVAKSAWVAAQAAKGTSVTADGGIISLTINPDGTGSISPAVTYQCHSWDAKGNDLQKTLNYRLAVTSCYTSMSGCRGTYVVSGTEKWHNTGTTIIGDTTGTWTATLEADGTYLFKIPNGHPPFWGDIPYRLK